MYYVCLHKKLRIVTPAIETNINKLNSYVLINLVDKKLSSSID